LAGLRAGEKVLSTPRWLARAGELAPIGVLLLAMLNYVMYFGRASFRNYDAFNAPSFDLGIFDQGVWLLSRFKSPFVTMLGVHLFGDHTSFIMLAFVPVYWVWPSAKALLLAQALALAAGAVPVYLLSRIVLRDSWLPLFPALAYLVTPAVGWINMENFHPDAFEVPLLLFAIYFMVKRRWIAFAVMAFLLLSIKEDVALVVAPLGLYVAFRYNRRVGLLTFAVSVVWLLLAVFVIGPYFSGYEVGALDAWRIPFGGVGGLVKTMLTSPWDVGGLLFESAKLKYVFQLMTPLLFLPVLTPLSLVVLPALFFNLVSNLQYQHELQYHYTSSLVPVLAAAAVLAIGRFHDRRVRRALAVLLLPAAVFSAYLWGPFEGTRYPSSFAVPGSARPLAAREAISMIPPDAVVSSRFSFSSHLAHREQVYDFPNPFMANYWGDDSQKGERLPEADQVEYVLEIPTELFEPAPSVYQQLAEEGFQSIFEKEGIVLLKRAATPGETAGLEPAEP
jgi:uncharacterized membrane protein